MSCSATFPPPRCRTISRLVIRPMAPMFFCRSRKRFGHQSVAGGSAAGTAAGVVQDDNVGTPTVVAAGTVNLVNTLPPTPPPVAPLLAATGGVEAAPPADSAPPADTTPPQENAGGPGTGDQPPSTQPVVPATTIVNDGVLSQAELDTMVDAAIARWSTTGLTAEQVAALHGMTFTVGDMSGLNLGSFSPTQITLDADAAGRGWYTRRHPAATTPSSAPSSPPPDADHPHRGAGRALRPADHHHARDGPHARARGLMRRPTAMR